MSRDTPHSRLRPRTITLIGWLFIAVGCVGILRTLLPLLSGDAARQMAELRARGLAELGPAWASSLVAALGGALILYGLDWARWVLVAWMAFHIVLSARHSLWELSVHCLLFTPILYFLFRPQAGAYFRGSRITGEKDARDAAPSGGA